jgi:hypothetical protein
MLLLGEWGLYRTGKTDNSSFAIGSFPVYLDFVLIRLIKYSKCVYWNNDIMEKKYHAVGTVPKSNRRIGELETKSISLTHTYMTTHV